MFATLTNAAFFLSLGFFVSAKGPMATQRVLPQSKETLLQSYNKRLKDDVKSILENFTEIIKTAKVCRANALSIVLFLFNLCSVRRFIILRSVLLNYLVFIYDNVLFLQIEDETQVSRPTQAEQDHYEMHVRAANIVCLCHKLLRGSEERKICFTIS